MSMLTKNAHEVIAYAESRVNADHNLVIVIYINDNDVYTATPSDSDAPNGSEVMAEYYWDTEENQPMMRLPKEY